MVLMRFFCFVFICLWIFFLRFWFVRNRRFRGCGVRVLVMLVVLLGDFFLSFCGRKCCCLSFFLWRSVIFKLLKILCLRKWDMDMKS